MLGGITKRRYRDSRTRAAYSTSFPRTRKGANRPELLLRSDLNLNTELSSHRKCELRLEIATGLMGARTAVSAKRVMDRGSFQIQQSTPATDHLPSQSVPGRRRIAA